MNVRPLHDRIIVRRLEEGEQQFGRIIVPDSAKEKPQRGTVLSAGSGKTGENGKRVALDVKAGDQILFGKYSGQEIKLEGDEYLIMKEDDVLAVITGRMTKAPVPAAATTARTATTTTAAKTPAAAIVKKKKK
jgi:chaperonin GroES